jgi:hypothetical protein
MTSSKIDKVESEVPWSQTTMDDGCYVAPQVLFSQSAGNTNRPQEQPPNVANTALRDHFMRLIQADREDKENLLAARREWESRNAAAEANTDDIGDDKPEDDAEWDSALWNQNLH